MFLYALINKIMKHTRGYTHKIRQIMTVDICFCVRPD